MLLCLHPLPQLHRNWRNKFMLFTIVAEALMAAAPAFDASIPWWYHMKLFVRLVAMSGLNSFVLWVVLFCVTVLALLATAFFAKVTCSPLMR